MSGTRTPVLFIHGLWLHHTSWQPWVELFEARGYAALAPAWPHEPATVEEARLHPDRVANQSLKELVEHFRAIAASLPMRPILIGHSFGGLIVEKLLGEDVGAAGVAIDPASIKGVLPLPLSELRAGLPALGNPANIHRSVALTAKDFRYSFGNALSEAESDALHARWTIPSPARPLFEVAAANFNPHAESQVNTHNSRRGPLLLISGTADHTAPDVGTNAAFRLYRDSLAVTALERFEGRGHSLVIDHGWREVALAVLEWLDQQGLAPQPRFLTEAD